MSPVYVLDASAILRMLDREAGWERVAALLEASWEGSAEILLSAVQWGEIAGKLRKRLGPDRQNQALADLSEFHLHIVEVTPERAVRAAELKVDHGIGYADAFALEVALEKPGSVLVTADYGFKAVEAVAAIEFLPGKESASESQPTSAQ